MSAWPADCNLILQRSQRWYDFARGGPPGNFLCMCKPNLAKIIEDMQMPPSQVALESRMSPEALHQAIGGATPDRNHQLKLEAVLDQAIWSTPEEFNERRNLRKFLGCEPLILTTEQLKRKYDQLVARARKLGLFFRKSLANKEQLLASITEIVREISQGEPLDPKDRRLLRCLSCGWLFEANSRPEFCPGCGSLRFCGVGG